MAKKAMVEKQKRREKKVAQCWEKRKSLKAKISSITTDDEERLAAVDELNKMSKDSSKIRLRNRCKITGRPRGYLRKFKLSRICFREMASRGLIPGVFKASW